MKPKKSPDEEVLRFLSENYRYDPSTGRFWKSVGSVSANGYVRICTKSGDKVLNMAAHNLAVFLMTGNWPNLPIDHINRARHDNRWENLRECSYSDNNFNKLGGQNRAGHRGVTPHGKRFRARLGHKGITYELGKFDTPQEAAKAYEAKAREIYGHIA